MEQQSAEMKRPKIGVGAIIIRDGKVLMTKRFGAHGADKWSLVGGHLEWKESFEEAARREVYEEVGLKVISSRFAAVTNDIFDYDDRHYITIYMLVEVEPGEPENKEPEKCQEMRWARWDDMPQPLVICIENLLKQGYRPEGI